MKIDTGNEVNAERKEGVDGANYGCSWLDHRKCECGGVYNFGSLNLMNDSKMRAEKRCIVIDLLESITKTKEKKTFHTATLKHARNSGTISNNNIDRNREK